MRIVLIFLSISIVPEAAAAQSLFDRGPVTHDELFGSQLSVPPSPSAALTPLAGQRLGGQLNGMLGGPGNIPFGGAPIAQQHGPAQVGPRMQPDNAANGDHDDLQFTPYP